MRRSFHRTYKLRLTFYYDQISHLLYLHRILNKLPDNLNEIFRYFVDENILLTYVVFWYHYRKGGIEVDHFWNRSVNNHRENFLKSIKYFLKRK